MEAVPIIAWTQGWASTVNVLTTWDLLGIVTVKVSFSLVASWKRNGQCSDIFGNAVYDAAFQTTGKLEKSYMY